MVVLGKGKASLEVSQIGFGAMGLTAFYGDLTPEIEALQVLKRAFDLGVTHFDTAQIYQRRGENGTVHYNEELVGKFLKTLSPDERKRITVATKFYPAQWSEKIFRDATNDSLKRLGVDKIDLYYFHRVIPEDVAPVKEWMGAAKKLVEEGKIARIGLSEASAKVIREANSIYPITCIQQEWSLFARDLEDDIVPTCRELGVGVISYSPVGRGFLAGSFAKKGEIPTDWRASIPYMSEKYHESNLKLLDEFKKIATSKGCTLSQLALAWVVAKGGVPIPGTTKLKHLEENMGALKVKLSSKEVDDLSALGDKVAGQRGDESYMSRTYHNNL